MMVIFLKKSVQMTRKICGKYRKVSCTFCIDRLVDILFSSESYPGPWSLRRYVVTLNYI